MGHLNLPVKKHVEWSFMWALGKCKRAGSLDKNLFHLLRNQRKTCSVKWHQRKILVNYIWRCPKLEWILLAVLQSVDHLCINNKKHYILLITLYIFTQSIILYGTFECPAPSSDHTIVNTCCVKRWQAYCIYDFIQFHWFFQFEQADVERTWIDEVE